MALNYQFPIRVLHPKKPGLYEIPAERTNHGTGYKPCIALLPGGDLIMVSLLAQGSAQEKNYHEVTPIRRSKDVGKTWSKPEIIKDMIGREQWLTCTSNGTLFSTSTILINDTANQEGINYSYLHRSVDEGRTWERTRILLQGEERRGVPLNEWGGLTWGVKPFPKLEKSCPRFLHVRKTKKSCLKAENE